MSAACNHTDDLPTEQPGFRRARWWVIAINAGMFVVEGLAGWQSGSLALLSDSLDFAADAATYGISLAVLGASLSVRSWAAIAKGASMGVLGAWILVMAVLAILGRSPLLAMIGALLFVVSDSVLAVRLFAGELDWAGPVVWVCYYLGQAAITLGLVTRPVT